MAASLATKYRRPNDNALVNVNISIDIVKFRPQDASRTSLGDVYYLKLSGGTNTTPWYRRIDGHIMDGLRGYKLGIDGGTSVTSSNGGTPSNSLGDPIETDVSVEGLLTQLEKPAAPTYVDATAVGSGEVIVQFIASSSSDDYVAGYYLFHSSDGETWTRVQSLGSGIAKSSFTQVTVNGTAKLQYQFASGTTGTKYIGVTAVASVSDSSEFPESSIGQDTSTIDIT